MGWPANRCGEAFRLGEPCRSTPPGDRGGWQGCDRRGFGARRGAVPDAKWFCCGELCNMMRQVFKSAEITGFAAD